MPVAVEGNNLKGQDGTATACLSAAEIQAWLVAYLAEMLDIEADEIDETIPFARYDLDSSAAVAMTGDLEEWLEREFDPTVLYDYPTIELLTAHLASEVRSKV